VNAIALIVLFQVNKHTHRASLWF